jgi:hypothetical protein
MVTIKFGLGRRLLSTFMTIYVPTIMLNRIALSTNYFKVSTAARSLGRGASQNF